MDNVKEALEYLVGLGETEILNIGGHDYSTKKINFVENPSPMTLRATTLTSMVDYLNSGIDKKASEQLLIHVVSPNKVILYSAIKDDKSREAYMECDALLPDNIEFNRFRNTEEFNIMLQSSFLDTEDKTILLKVTGNIQDNMIKEIGDDGVSQSATIKVGVAKVADVKVPNPVILAPFRTFPEIQQPKSKFIFRMQSGPAAALYEADGGKWKNDAMDEIKEYLKDELKDMPNVKIIS